MYSIKLDLHTHTNASVHAYSTLTENAKYASDIGMEGIAITNHAPGMPDGVMVWHFDCLRLIPRMVCGVKIIRGAECSFQNEDAEIDLDEKTLKSLDLVIASVHTPAYAPKTSEEHTKMLFKAMDNPYIDILGHIDRVKCGADYDAVAKAASEKNKVIEYNIHSLDISDLDRIYGLISACKKYGTMIAVNSDAHFHESIGHFEKGYGILEELDFDCDKIINTSVNRFNMYLKSKGKNII